MALTLDRSLLLVGVVDVVLEIPIQPRGTLEAFGDADRDVVLHNVPATDDLRGLALRLPC